ncbi:hypothetical protein G4B88_020193 [Cannabis sativa]|uniref:Ubiquitin-like protease family profile domain-containing protein n=1 Tax=Cannabis sativa TaxID=3483 RepID=A0A7J6FG30_CANSA|nr:hypothetical protein G4B88_020193 [Cannabis sativa]
MTNIIFLALNLLCEQVLIHRLLKVEGYAKKTIEDDDFDILEVASFWNKGKSLDDFNDKAYDEFIDSGITVVGPFKTKEAIPCKLFGFYKFVFSNTLDLEYVLAKFGKFEVDRRCMASLRPLGEVQGSRIAKEQEWSTLFYEDIFKKCIKMFVPILTLEGPPHWLGVEVNMKSKVVSFMDSLHTAMDEKYCVDATKEILSTLDLLFDENKSKNVSFVDFGIDTKEPCQEHHEGPKNMKMKEKKRESDERTK